MQTLAFRFLLFTCIVLAAGHIHGQPTVFTVTNASASGAGSLSAILGQLNAACPASARVEFAIPAATDPNCDPASGICRIDIPDSDFGVRCSNTVVDGYTQPGAAPNTATDLTNTAQIKIELTGTGPATTKYFTVYGQGHSFGYHAIFNVTLRGLALPRHQVTLHPNNSGSVVGGGGGHNIEGNWFGWHADGTRAQGIVSRGVYIFGAYQSGITIGGPGPGQRNLFTYRDAFACCEYLATPIDTFGAENLLVEGNYINVSPAGQPVATIGIGTGISLSCNSSNSFPCVRNSVVRNNVVLGTANLPIQLAGGPGITTSRNVVTGHPAHLPAWDHYPPGHSGANAQTPPAIHGVTSLPAEVRVYGTAFGGPGSVQRIELFHNDAPYAAGAARTGRFVSSIDVPIPASGSAAFEASLPPDTRNVAASATHLGTGETSKLNNGAAPSDVVPLHITFAGTGPGSIFRGSNPSVTCADDCTLFYPRGARDSIWMVQPPGSEFVGWTGDCVGQVLCEVTMDDTRRITAHYRLAGGPPVIVNPPLSADATFGTPFSFTYDADGAPPFTWSLEPPCGLPIGFSLDPATGTISGTPDGNATRYTCAIRVSNGQAPDAVQDFEIRVNGGTTLTRFDPAFELPQAFAGAPYRFSVTAQSDGGSITIFNWAGNFPPGLIMSTGGDIFGAPTAVGTYDFMLRAIGGGQAFKRFRIVVLPGTAPTITSGAPANGTQFVAYSHTFTAAGTAPVAWSVDGGALPAGLTLSASGVLSGTPSVAGTFQFTVRASNGTAPDATQAVTLVLAVNARTLTLVRNGTGAGTVVSSPAGIECVSGCTAQFPTGTSVTLTATPAADSLFTGWAGVCSGTGTCTVTLSANRTVSATFTRKRVNLEVTMTNSGVVQIAPNGGTCNSGTCNAAYDMGTVVTLTASNGSNTRFAGWEGACSGAQPTCEVAMDAAKAVTARFVRQFTLTVTRQGAGTGTVDSTPAGIACGATCTARYDAGTVVALRADGAIGSVFAGWSGACAGTGSCSVTLDANTSVTASFAIDTLPLTLEVRQAGMGTIRVVGSGLDQVCEATCTLDIPRGREVTVTATPGRYSALDGWLDGCRQDVTSCTLVMNGPRSARAHFSTAFLPLEVRKAGDGKGTIHFMSPACGEDCPGATTMQRASPTGPRLVASAATGSVFAGWSGPCETTSTALCEFDFAAPATVTATFTSVKRTLTVTANVVGSITSSPAGLACAVEPNGATLRCTGTFPQGTSVTLTGSPAFSGAQGCARLSDTACRVEMTEDRVVSLGFASQVRTVRLVKRFGKGMVATTHEARFAFPDCGEAENGCVRTFTADDTALFTPTAAPGHVFRGWALNASIPPYVGFLETCNLGTAQCLVPLDDFVVQHLTRSGNPLDVVAHFVKIPAALQGVASGTAPATARATRVGTAFAPHPAIRLVDEGGNAVPGAPVTFTVIPGPNGAGAVVAATNPVPLPPATRTTGDDGTATHGVVANGIAGTWILRVTSVLGAVAPLDIVMTNHNDPIPVTLPASSTVSVPTSSLVPIQLTVKVADPAGRPVQGATVRFSAPASPNAQGFPIATGTLSPSTATTNSRGVARTALTSNGIRGSFSVTVRVTLPRSARPGAAPGFEGDDYVTDLFVQATDDLPSDVVAQDPNGDFDADGIPNAVEDAEGTLLLDKDNDIFGDARLFAMQQYRDFLSREGDEGGIAHWAGEVAAGARSRSQLVQDFFGSAEFQGAVAPVARLYSAYFLRIPDYEGIRFWSGHFRAGNSLESISQLFAQSAEFTQRYGALDDAQFVELLYRNVLGRAPDAQGHAFWTGRLASGAMTRGQLMLGFSESPEFRALTANEVFVTMTYIGMLRRAPDDGGFAFWVDYLDGGKPGLALIDLFLGSTEYRQRFLP